MTLGEVARSEEKPARKTRSDAGIKKGPKVPEVPDGIRLTFKLEDARSIAMTLGAYGCTGLASYIQDEIIAQLQKRIDSLQKLQTK